MTILNLWRPRTDIPTPISSIHFAYLKIPINDPVDEFQFLIPFLACAPFPIFVMIFFYLIKYET